MSTWEAWTTWDTPTILWLGWIVWFFALESWAIFTGLPQHTLTWHLRPFLLNHPLTWFMAFGLWLWLGIHFLAPSLEQWILRAVVGGSS